MTEETKTASSDQDNASGTDQGENSQQDHVSYDSFRKSVEAEKRAKRERDAMREELESYRQKELESKGNYEQLVAELKKKTDMLSTQLKEKDTRYALTQIKNTFTTQALQEGCKAPDKLFKLLDKSDIEMIEVDDNFNVSGINEVLERVKKENSFLFSQKTVRMSDGVPAKESDFRPKSKPLKDLSNDELMKLLKQ